MSGILFFIFASCHPLRHTIPWYTIQGLLQPQEELYPIQPICNHRSRDQLLEFLRDNWQWVPCSTCLSKRISSTQFSRLVLAELKLTTSRITYERQVAWAFFSYKVIGSNNSFYSNWKQCQVFKIKKFEFKVTVHYMTYGKGAYKSNPLRLLRSVLDNLDPTIYCSIQICHCVFN